MAGLETTMRTIKPVNLAKETEIDLYRKILSKIEIRPTGDFSYVRDTTVCVHSGADPHNRKLIIDPHNRKLIADNTSLSWHSPDCWIYIGRWQDGKGHKKIKHKNETLYVHRVTYTICRGDIPKDAVLDHTCKNPSCCNPFHLEPVSTKENTMRGSGKWIFEQGYTPDK